MADSINKLKVLPSNDEITEYDMFVNCICPLLVLVSCILEHTNHHIAYCVFHAPNLSSFAWSIIIFTKSYSRMQIRANVATLMKNPCGIHYTHLSVVFSTHYSKK